MMVNIELKGIEEIRERLSEIGIDAQIQQAVNRAMAELKEELKKPTQRKQRLVTKGSGELRPSVNYPYGISATDRAWKSIQFIQDVDELLFRLICRGVDNDT